MTETPNESNDLPADEVESKDTTDDHTGQQPYVDPAVDQASVDDEPPQ